jgi:hypothetical protein
MSVVAVPGAERAAAVLAWATEMRDLRDRVAVLEVTVARQDAYLARLQSSRGAFGDADVRLLVAIHAASLGLPFKAAQVMRRAGDVQELQAALDDALIETAQELGLLFGRLQDVTVGGVRLARVRFTRGGWWWRTRTVRTDQQCSGEAQDD